MKKLMYILLLPVLAFALTGTPPVRGESNAITNPILFVTQVPIRADFTTIGSVFGNHRADMDSVGRGGDLYIRYPDGTLKNLTQAAGYGIASGFQNENAIAVRDPAVHWSGAKALFSMVVGAPKFQYDYAGDFVWQIYEISGLGKNDTPVITKIPNQPASYNNITPIYGTDERIIFTSDRPHNGAANLYPQLDEYEAPVVTGLWSLDPDASSRTPRNASNMRDDASPQTGDLFLLNHSPSGAFTPTLDSFGRIIFTRWDHLQRDQQADADRDANAGYDSYGYGNGCPAYCTFNYASEAAGAAKLATRQEVFPEPRADDQTQGTNLWGHTFNHFTPWQIGEDGTGEETLNHLGRHELNGYIPPSLTDDPNLYEYYGQDPRANQNDIENFLQVKEDPTLPGRYFGIDAPEFYTHASGQVISINGAPTVNADTSVISYWTHRDTASFTDNPSPNHSGHYRDPLPLTSGTIIVAHTNETRGADDGDYDFQLKPLTQLANGYWGAGTALTGGITKDIWWWSPDARVDFNGALWELQPVEVVGRAKPPRLTSEVPAQEKTAIENAGVTVSEISAWMKQNNLALMVSRNVTQRDDFDRQQPYNLRVADGGAQTIGAGGKIYTLKFFQFFQADMLRGIGGHQDPRAGRRVLAQALHDTNAVNATKMAAGGPPGSVAIAPDGSVAAFLPARRALTWQTTDANGTGVVRERMWITFQPGEVRVCTSCHGVNDKDQAGNSSAMNIPQALTELMTYWKTNNGNDCNSKPVAPTQIAPANNASVTTRRVALDWDDVTCATQYQVFVRQGSPKGTRVDQNKNVPASNYLTIRLNKHTTYIWRVKACNTHGCTKSPWQTFKIK